MRLFNLFVLLFILISAQSRAQLLRPPVKWYELESSHFRMIFHEGFDSVANATARILEHHYTPVQQLTGGALKRFPVVLNAYNDLSNGYVTPINFRMEVEIPPVKGKILNPKTGGWLENVMPHELVHAMHFSVVPTIGFSALLYPFWPDGVRSLHFIAPIGFHEGLAVHYETEMIPGESGRGNFSFFTNQINSVYASPERWSFGQYLNPVNQTRPYDRHYQGGYEFISWLQKHKGEHIATDVIDFMGRFPFLGYGGAYLFTQWEWPLTAFRAYEKDKQQAETERQNRLNTEYQPLNKSEVISFKNLKKYSYLWGLELNKEVNNGDNTNYNSMLIDLPYTGQSVRRPLFISNDEILFYGSFYDQKAGLYVLNLPNASLKRIHTTQTVEDYKFDFNPDSRSLLFARYDIDLKYDATYHSGIYEWDLSRSKLTPISTKTRVFNPEYASNKEILAFQNQKETNRLVRIDTTGTVTELLNPGIHNLLDVSYSSVTGKIAVLANIHGDIALFIAENEQNLSQLLTEHPVLFASGTVMFDPQWHPKEDKLLFTADPNGVMNVFEFDLQSNKVNQLTYSLFNAFEASYNEDGSRIVYVIQKGNEQKLSYLLRDSTQEKGVDYFQQKPRISLKSERVWSQQKLKTKPVTKLYKPGIDWLRPRGVVPFVGEHAMSRQYGVSLLGTDILQQHTWSSNLSWQFDRPWFDFSYQYTGFWPGFNLRFHKEPIDVLDPSGNYFIFGEQGIGIGIPFRFNLEQNISSTGLMFSPQLTWTSYSYETNSFDNSPEIAQNLSNLVDGSVFVASFFAQFNWKLVQRTRDLQPSEGIIAFTQSQIDLSTNPFYNLYGVENFRSGVRRRVGLLNGLYGFLPNPLFRNHSVRLGYRNLYQPHIAVYSLSNLIWLSGAQQAFRTSDWIHEFSARYTFPFCYPENGGVLLPWYVQNLYGVLFGRTHLGTVNVAGSSPINHIYGAGLRFVTGLSNIRIDLGVAWFFTYGVSEPTRWLGEF